MHTTRGDRRSWPSSAAQTLPCRSPSWGIVRQEAGFPGQQAKDLGTTQVGPQEGAQRCRGKARTPGKEVTDPKSRKVSPGFSGSLLAWALPAEAGSGGCAGRRLSRCAGQRLDSRKSSKLKLWPPPRRVTSVLSSEQPVWQSVRRWRS